MLKPVLCINTTKCVLKVLKNMFILSKIDLGMALNLTLRLNGLELGLFEVSSAIICGRLIVVLSLVIA